MKYKIVVFFSILAVVILTGAAFAYFSFSAKSGGGSGVVLKNPVAELSDEEAGRLFDDRFISYLLYAIDADELRNVPLTSDTPKIELRVGDDLYFAEIVSGRVIVKKGDVSEEDIVLITSKEEAVKMLRDLNYVRESFQNGESVIELKAGQTKLFAKGYLKIYDRLK